MTDSPGRKVEASGDRAVAAQAITGTVVTGDDAVVDDRTINLAAGAIPHPADVAAPPGIQNLPRRPTPVFVGREYALGKLRGALADDASAVVTQAVYGLGGVGKSELALHHADARRADYTLIWWITAEDPAQIQAGLAALAGRLCHEIAMVSTTAEAADWAMAWLQAHHRWLLIFDNVTDAGDVESLLGQLTGGHTLVTTRRDAGWDQIADPIRLDVLDPGPAVQLLTRRTGGHDTDQSDAASIAAELGYLPLALHQATAYINQTRITLAVYLQRLRAHPADMYAAAAGGQAQQTITRVWDITIETVRARNPAAIKLLQILACYAPDNVPRLVLGGQNETDMMVIDEALALLASYSIITLTSDAVSMHRLVQAVVIARQPPQGEAPGFGGKSPLRTALHWLDDAIPANPGSDMTGWPLLRALVPHAESLAKLFPVGDQPFTLGRVQNELSIFHDSQGQYEQALALSESARAVIEAKRGPDHPDTAAILGRLAFACWRLGRHVKALELEQRALAITEATLGRDHPTAAIRLTSLAAIYGRLGQDAEALPLQQRALAITEAALGPEHPRTATMLDNLATIYSRLGQGAEAVPLQQRAVAITEATLGPDHPSTGLCLNNLAAIYSRLEQDAEALPLRQRALAVTEAALGPDHPSTATMLGNLAAIYSRLGQDAEALPLRQRALAIAEAALGPDHPEKRT